MTVRDGSTPEARAEPTCSPPGFPIRLLAKAVMIGFTMWHANLVDGFGLTFDQALPIFQDWNRDKAPPGEEKQVRHKLNQAIKNHPAPSLKRLNADRHKGTGKGTPTGPPHWPPLRFSEPPRAYRSRWTCFRCPCKTTVGSWPKRPAPLDFVGLSMLVTAGVRSASHSTSESRGSGTNPRSCSASSLPSPAKPRAPWFAPWSNP